MLHISKQKGDCMMDSPGKRRTSQLTRSECAELIEYVLAWAAEHGIATARVDPETGEIYQ